MAGRNSGVSSNVTDPTDKRKMQRFTIFNTTYIDTQRTPVWKIPQMANVVISKLVNVTGSKGMNHRQLKDLNTQMRSISTNNERIALPMSCPTK
jgi:hypothetical protein